MVRMSVSSGLYALRFIASKNICSLGYIQLPVFLSAPVSFSLFAGLADAATGCDGKARGIVDISRSVASFPALAESGD